ncbi:MAG TPA: BamA/TamA family outer membrane protein [Longimicrobiales bacterium]
MRRANLRLLLATSLCTLPAALSAQNVVTKPADAGHAAGALHRALFGSGYRDTWTVPITVPVLDLNTFAGGLTAFQEGGNQSRTLRFRGADGKVYHFRSTPKFLPRSMPEDLHDTPAGNLIQDQSSAMHPTGHLLVAGMQAALNVLQPSPQLVVLPDDPRLGKFRKDFAGMMGQIEERPQDYDDNKALNFAGADKVQGADKLIENLEQSMEYSLAAREYLRLRLVDLLVGDTDRGADQWEFARFDQDGRKVYRPVPRDRDYAFMNSDGLLIRLASYFYPKLTTFSERYGQLSSYLFMTREFDRSHLSELTWADWEREIGHLESALSDRVIDNALLRIPAEHRQVSGPRLASALKVRRDNLRAYARKYYHWVSEEAVVFASDENEHAEVERHSDGSVTVRLYRQGQHVAGTNGGAPPAWQRRFLPGETSEIRVHLERGNDRAIVRGGSRNTIDVRIMGGEGDDVLIDSTRASGGHTYTTFYDAHGNNTFVTGSHTRVSRKPYVTHQPPMTEDEKKEGTPRVAQEERRGRYQDLMNMDQGFIEQKTVAQWIRDWGQNNGVGPAFEWREGTGVILGLSYGQTDFGFRREPYETRYALTGFVSPTTGRLGAQFFWDRHPENSDWSYSLLARATQYESNRFFGWGNDTEFIDDMALSLVRRDEVQLFPSLNYRIGKNSFISLGPIFKWNNPHIESFSPAANLLPFGVDGSMSQLGARVETVINTADTKGLPRGGYTIRAGGSSYAGALDLPRPFHEVHAMAATYLSFGSPVLAVRAGGKHIIGDVFPLHEAAFIGGLETLRGYRWNRFTGDQSVFGGAELRVPITRAVIFTRGDLGIVGLADAGRVAYLNESGGGWHTSYGGGLWFQTLGHMLTATYAQGSDEGQFYIQFGAPF